MVLEDCQPVATPLPPVENRLKTKTMHLMGILNLDDIFKHLSPELNEKYLRFVIFSEIDYFIYCLLVPGPNAGLVNPSPNDRGRAR